MKPKLYLLAGTMCDSSLWQYVEEELALSYELHFLEVSQWQNLDQIVASLAMELEGENNNLVGFSLGGYLASLLAIRYPQKVKKVLVVSNSPTSLPEHEVKQRLDTIKVLNKFHYVGMTQARALEFLAPNAVNKQGIANQLQAMEKNVGLELFQQVISATTERQNLKSALLVKNIDVQFIYGAEDKLVDSKWMQEFLEIGKVEVVNQCGHMLPLEQPQLLIKAALSHF